ncbi:hypothetical protein CSQ96_15005 [Janthinobacterium sp. BJB412]|nr:hypothetical protein CSQ96_15005 [Janthinobacterium sp. BJB412]
MQELRILNGLHRGATLPLDAQAIHIGADESADVVMADHGIAPDHALLSPSGDGWLLTATGGAIYAADSNRPQQLVELTPGACARLGDIWLGVAWQQAPWQAPPPLPEAEPEFDPRAALDDSTATGAAADAGARAPARGRTRGVWRRRAAGACLIAAAATLAATAYALTTRPSPPAAAPAPATAIAADKPAAAPASASAQPGPAVAGTPALAALFRKRLADAELLNRFDLSLEARAWTMRAQLDDEETARFERILNSFIKEHRITFPVSAKAVTAEAMLPFRIGQVISGANASVVTQDGARLRVGDDYRGVRLVAIQASHVTFLGKRKIEVIW